ADDALPPGELGKVVALGKEIVENTGEHPLSKKYVGNALACTSCHLDAGTDPLAVVAEFCKAHEIELFWSLRMNDTHDGSRTDYGPIMLRSNRLKLEHPEYLLGTRSKRPKYGAWTAVDYGRPE